MQKDNYKKSQDFFHQIKLQIVMLFTKFPKILKLNIPKMIKMTRQWRKLTWNDTNSKKLRKSCSKIYFSKWWLSSWLSMIFAIALCKKSPFVVNSMWCGYVVWEWLPNSSNIQTYPLQISGKRSVLMLFDALFVIFDICVSFKIWLLKVFKVHNIFCIKYCSMPIQCSICYDSNKKALYLRAHTTVKMLSCSWNEQIECILK